MKTGDTEKDPSFRGHPECEFCRKHFYSPDELYEHCREKHETCHICRQQGVRDQYYRDYQALVSIRERQLFIAWELINAGSAFWKRSLPMQRSRVFGKKVCGICQ